MPPEAVPPLRKRILRPRVRWDVLAIVATQMLESMVHSPTPTRAEAWTGTVAHDGAFTVVDVVGGIGIKITELEVVTTIMDVS
jgi:pyruvate kinase